jgi:hypothetical protein
MAALLVAALMTAVASLTTPDLENPGVPCVGFYFTTCSIIDLVPVDAP